jgi:hypothetical protein
VSRKKAITTSQDRKLHAERSWDSVYRESIAGNVDIQRLGASMTALNTADYIINKERAYSAERRMKEIPVNWESPENRAIETHFQILDRILQEIMDEI